MSVRARAIPSKTKRRSRLLKKLSRPRGGGREQAAGRYGGRTLVSDAMRVDPVETDGVLFLAQEPPMSSTTADRDPVIHLAIELSCSTWLVAARLPGDEKPRLHRLGGGYRRPVGAYLVAARSRRGSARLADRRHLLL